VNDEAAARVLLVEDNPQDLELTLRALRRAGLGADVHVARDGVEALDFVLGPGGGSGAAPARRLQLILLDLKLPKCDGLEVISRLKSDPRTRAIPIVVLTSSREASDVARSYQLGANSYVVKPVEYDRFSNAVAQAGLYWLSVNQPPGLE